MLLTLLLGCAPKLALPDQPGQAIAIHWAWDIDGRWHGGAVGVGLAVAAEQWPALAELLPRTWPPCPAGDDRSPPRRNAARPEPT